MLDGSDFKVNIDEADTKFKSRKLRRIFRMASIFKANENTSDYEVGSWDVRSWGHYMVTSVEKNKQGQVTRCEKEITVFPYQMLSLQVHQGKDMKGNNLGHCGRNEIWTVMEGELTYIQNGVKKTAMKGDRIELAAGDIHCMINGTKHPVKVHEIQTGICQELDNIRLKDMAGREVVNISHPALEKSRQLYQQIMDDMPTGFAQICNQVDNKIRVWTNRARYLSRQAA